MIKYIVFAMVGIVLISGLAVAVTYNLSGALSTSSYAYGRSKVYGGGIRKAYAENPRVFGQAYGEAVMTQRYQKYLYSHKDEWVCTFGKEAETSKYPCVFDKSKGKYCCILDTGVLSPGNR